MVDDVIFKTSQADLYQVRNASEIVKSANQYSQTERQTDKMVKIIIEFTVNFNELNEGYSNFKSA